MNITIVIILCVLIAIALILFPLIVSHKAERFEKKDEWSKIQDYGDRVNNKVKKKNK